MPDLKSPDGPKNLHNSGSIKGVWQLSQEGLVLVNVSWAGAPVILVPTEDVRVLVLDLPMTGRAQRAAAVPFVIEDRIAESPELSHTALGEAVAPGRYLAGVVRHDRMAAWCAAAAESGLGGAAMVPDALALPVPAADAWAIAVQGARALVRTGDGSAFAIPVSALEAIWDQAGRPALSSYGEALPTGIVHDPMDDGLTIWPVMAGPVPLDLRQGGYAAVSTSRSWLRQAALVVVLGLVAHAGLVTIDTLGLMRSADKKRASVATLVTQAGGPPGGDLAATAEAMLPRPPVAPSGLTPLLGRVARALQPLGPSVTLTSVVYAGDAGLTLALEASDPATLQQAQSALAGAGLNPVSSGATVEGGTARDRIVISAGASA